MRWRGALVLALLCCALTAGATRGAPTSTHVHFTAAGDYGSTANTSGVLNALAAGGSDAHLALGDFSYGTAGAEEDWCTFVKSRVGQKFPFELISGNHESNGQNGNVNDFSACLPNQLPGLVGTYGRQWYVDVPQVNPLVRFVMASPNLGFPGVGQYNYPAGSSRYQWVSDTIDGARSAQIPWVVVGMHKPCVSLGEYACDIGADLTNLLISKKVDLVLNGHEHLYQRTKQLALGAGCGALTTGSYNPSCVADSDSTLTKGAGTVFQTIGTGGVGLRDVNQSDPETGYFVASSGANLTPTYGFGDFDVTPDKLTASFVRGAGGAFTDDFTITKSGNPPQNQSPVADFSSTTTGLTASFDSTGSNDPDGTIASYAWDFGDGTSSSAANPSRTYAASGAYTVTLTVTDNQGATATTSKSVQVTSPPPAGVLASDSFERTSATGWGTADAGGPWTLRGSTARFSISGGAGRVQVPAGTTLYADIASVSSSSSKVVGEFSVDQLVEGQYVSLVGRQIGAESYVARLRLAANGSAKFNLLRSSSDTMGSASFTPALTFAPNTRYRMAILVQGTSPSTISGKVWKVGDPEPAWQRTASSTFAGLQAKGQVGLFSYVPTGAAGAPGTVSFWQYDATDAG